MDGLDALSGIEFENLIKQLLELMGFHTEMTKASGDGGIDIIATLDQPLTGGRYLIQCKRYAADSLVGSATVREFYGALTADRRAAKGILITTSGFTAQALEFAENLPIELIGRSRLEQLLKQNGLGFSAGCQQFGSVEAMPPEDRALLLLNSAIELNEGQKYGEAIKALREATQLQPKNPVLWLWSGICCRFAGLDDDAIAALREAVLLQPDYGLAWYFLGSGLWSVGEVDAAVDALRRAGNFSPDDPNTWILLGEIYWNRGDKEQALFAWQKATDIKPGNGSAWRGVGRVHFSRKEYREAISAFLEAVRIDPNDAESWNLLAITHLEVGDRARMLQALTRLDQLDPARAREFERAFLSN